MPPLGDFPQPKQKGFERERPYQHRLPSEIAKSLSVGFNGTKISQLVCKASREPSPPAAWQRNWYQGRRNAPKLRLSLAVIPMQPLHHPWAQD